MNSYIMKHIAQKQCFKHWTRIVDQLFQPLPGHSFGWTGPGTASNLTISSTTWTMTQKLFYSLSSPIFKTLLKRYCNKYLINDNTTKIFSFFCFLGNFNTHITYSSATKLFIPLPCILLPSLAFFLLQLTYSQHPHF